MLHMADGISAHYTKTLHGAGDGKNVHHGYAYKRPTGKKNNYYFFEYKFFLQIMQKKLKENFFKMHYQG